MLTCILACVVLIVGCLLNLRFNHKIDIEAEERKRHVEKYPHVIINDDLPSKTKLGYVLSGVLSVFILAMGCVYLQDVGETIVLRNFGGSLGNSSTDAGIHFKLPWQTPITFDIRNNLVNFYGDAEYSYEGGSAEGPDVTINDSSGTAADIDIQVNYSLDADKAAFLYTEYGTQTNFTQNYVSNDLRSIAREVAGQFDTITMLTDRIQYTKAVQERLSEKWNSIGLTVEQVSVQDVRYPDEIKSKYAEAQAAVIAKQQALNEQETAKVNAETQKIEAQGEADANRILTESLTTEVIQQNYIDALKEIGKSGNLVVVPEGTTSVVTTGK